MARLSNAERDQKKLDGKNLYIKGFSLQSISSIVKISLDSIRKWHKEGEWERAKELANISPSEIENMVLENIKAIKEGKPLLYKSDDISKLVASLDRLKDKKRKAVYTMQAFMDFDNKLLEIAGGLKGSKREERLQKIKELRQWQDEYVNSLLE